MSISVTESKVARLLSLAIVSIMVLIPFHAFFSTWLGANFGHLDLFRIWKELLMIAMSAATLWLAYQHKSTKDWFTKQPLILLIALYVLLSLLLGIYATFTDKVSGTALIYGLLVNLRFLFFFVICAVTAAYMPVLGKNWAKFMLLPAAAVIIFGLSQLLLPSNFLTHFGYGPSTISAYHTVDQKLDYMRIQSTLRGPNPLGTYLIVILTTIVGWMIWHGKSAKMIALGMLGLLALFFTYSRSAWLGLVISLLFLVFVTQKIKIRKQKVIIAGLAGLALLTGFIFIFRENNLVQNTLFHVDETSRSAESSNEQRSEAITKGLSSVVKQPFGQGPGTAGPASVRNTSHKTRISENYFIQIGQEVGIIGLGLFIAILYIVAHQLWQKRGELLPQVLLASLTGLIVINLLSHAFTDDTLAFIWWGLAGIALAPVIMNKERKKTNA